MFLIFQKQALLEKKIAYHLQKMQRDDVKRDRPEENIFENKGQDEKEGKRETIETINDKVSKQKMHMYILNIGGFVKTTTTKTSMCLCGKVRRPLERETLEAHTTSAKHYARHLPVTAQVVKNVHTQYYIHYNKFSTSVKWHSRQYCLYHRFEKEPGAPGWLSR